MEPLVVLLFDSSPLFLKSVAQFISEHAPDRLLLGEAVSANVESAAARLHPDLVLIGLGQFAQPGFHLLPPLRALLPHAFIIVLGQLEAPSYREAALAAGADAFVLKDDLPTTLLPTVAEVIQARRRA